jgi:CRP-like cAMP-binding protein
MTSCVPSRLQRKRQEGVSSCLTCQAFAETVFEALPADDVYALDAEKITKHFSSGDLLFREGETEGGLWCVGAGLICERRRNAAGDRVPLRLRAAGAVLGLRSFIMGGPADVAAEAFGPSRACFIPAKTMRGLLSRNLNLALAMVRGLLDELSTLEQRLLALRPLSPRSRLAGLLLEFANQIGVWRPDGSCAVRPAFAVSDLAAIAGVPVAIATETLKTLVNEGVVAVSARQVEILNADRLREIAAQPSPLA